MPKYLREEEGRAGNRLVTWASRTSGLLQLTFQQDGSDRSSVRGLWTSRQMEARRAPQAAAANIHIQGFHSTTWLFHRFLDSSCELSNIILLLLEFLTHRRFWAFLEIVILIFFFLPALIFESVVNYLHRVRVCMLPIRPHG